MAKPAKAHEEQTPEDAREERIENVVAVAIAIIVIAGIAFFALAWARGDGAAQPADDSGKRFAVSVDDDPVLGAATATVTIIEFSDYACEACAAFHRSTFPGIEEKYIGTGKARFVYRDFPLAIHVQGVPAAIAANCAGEQGKYWEFHDALYDAPVLGPSLYNATAQKLGLDMAAFDACRASPATAQEVQNDYAQGVQQGMVSATPTFFIDGRKIVGNKASELEAAIEEALAE